METIELVFMAKREFECQRDENFKNFLESSDYQDSNANIKKTTFLFNVFLPW